MTEQENTPTDIINGNFEAVKNAIANCAPLSLVQIVANKADSNHTHSQYLTSHQDISGKVNITDIASSVSTNSTNQVPVGAKLFYDTCGNIEALINAL